VTERHPGRREAPPAADDLPHAVRRAIGTRRRKVLVAITVGLGVLAAVTVTVGSPPADRSFVATCTIVQLSMSVVVPFFGVLLTSELRVTRPPDVAATPLRRSALLPRIGAAVVLAVAFALVGVLLSAVAVALAPSAAGAWQHTGAVVLGSVVVQVIAQLSGTGLGLLLSPPRLAMAATIVLPLGLWLLLGAVRPIRGAQDWLTPVASAGHLLSGQLPPLRWLQSLVVFLIWGAGLNIAGALRAGSRR
jgi:hypothetical protein